ncbi:hypothetical protein [Aquimarina algiphila]|uniref:hypothetical protein n=1 Tax=Aquimarina algiphila TaxID=2047982 RepID=UPI00249181A2|nr:hypothetical protein [Aquimarina algiphila]
MEPMNVFYRIFHEDLHPLTNQKTKIEYLDYFKSTNTSILTIQGYNRQQLKYYYYEQLLIDVLKQIKRDLHQKVFLFSESNTNISKVIQTYQVFLLNYIKIIEENYLSQQDTSSIFQISEDKSDTDIFKVIYKTMDNILVYLEQTFIKHIDPTLDIPYQQRLWFVSKHRDDVKNLQHKIDKLDLSEIVKKSICTPLLQIEKNELAGFTYESRAYYATFIKVFDHLLKSEPSPCEEKVYAVLISLNYNTFKVFFFITAIIKGKVKSCHSTKEKLQVYHEYIKKIKTTAVTSLYKRNPRLPSLKEQLLLWINEEIDFYNKKLEFEESKSFKSSNKKLIKISVPEVSLLTKLLYDTKLVEGPKTELFTFLSDTFSTPKAKIISPESLSNNYYSISESSKRSVKKMLKTMLLQLDRMEGEL